MIMFTYKDVIAVTNRKLCKQEYLEQIERICQKHPKAVVVREKDLSAQEYMRLFIKVNEICLKYHVPCAAHSFREAAELTKCRILHLPLYLLTEKNEKNVEGRLTGTSVHSLSELELAEKYGADYVFAGHIFATACKPDLEPRGTEFLKEICRASHIPVYAIGGMEATSCCIQEMKENGAAGICVMSECMRW